MIVSLVQPEVSDDLRQNLEQISSMITQAAKEGAQLVVLPELWNTPFINAKILEHADDFPIIIDALKQLSARLHLWIIAGTIPLKREGHLYNACLVFNDKGELEARADKLHLLEVHTSKNDYYEADVFTPGNRLVKVDTPWGAIGLVICFDMRFCEIPRLLSKDCFCLAAVCGFNENAGRKHWQPLMQTRAMENEVFVLALNPACADYGSYRSYGHSMAVSPDGQVLASLDSKVGILTLEINPDDVARIRKRSPFWNVRRTDLFRLEEKQLEN